MNAQRKKKGLTFAEEMRAYMVFRDHPAEIERITTLMESPYPLPRALREEVADLLNQLTDKVVLDRRGRR